MSNYVRRGTIRVATDASMTLVLNTTGSQFQLALDARLIEAAADVISSTPSIIAAAQAALDARVAALDILIGTDPRAMKMGDTYTHHFLDAAGKAIATADARTGVFTAPDLAARRASIAGAVTTESEEGVQRYLDSNGKRLFEINARIGQVFIGDLDPASNVRASGGGGEGRVARVLVLWECGQSNGAGRAKPYGPRLDIPHPRIQMAQWTDTTVTGVGIATVPVSNVAMLDTSGLDIATVIARQIVAEQEDTVVVICNAAKGGSAVVADSANGVWRVDYSGSNMWVLPVAKAALTATLSQVAGLWPGVPVDVQLIWHQGETDATQSIAVYKPALRAVLENLRAHSGDSTMPIVMGGTVPEDSSPAEETNIMGAQIALQGEMEYVAFAAGIPNGGGSNSVDDIVHYHRDGTIRLADHMRHALERAYVNQPASIPLPALDVFARWRKTAGVLDMSWSFPTCRATDFLPQYRVDGGAWQSITGRPRPLDPTAKVTGLTSGQTVEVRVATVNEVGTSAYTTPVIAIGA